MKKIRLGEIVKEENLFLIEDDYRKKRKCDVKGPFICSFIRSMSTLELISKQMDEIADQYPQEKFEIFYDGLIKIKIELNESTLFTGDFYDIEKFYQRSYYAFKEYINSQIEIVERKK